MARGNELPERSKGLVAASFILAVALVICAIIGSLTAIKVKGFGKVISVTGAAYKPITSNYAVWEGHISVSASSLEAAYTKIKENLKETEAFLQQKGFTADGYEVGTVQIRKNFNRERELLGYSLRQTIRVELDDVDRLTQLAKQASSLIEKGVELESGNPKYLFTGLDELKIEMIRAATENAKLRAAELARTTGRSVGAPTAARVGVFQIRALHSQEVSARGISDVSSIEKEIVSTVHINFLIE